MPKKCFTVACAVFTALLAGSYALAQDEYGPGVTIRAKGESRPGANADANVQAGTTQAEEARGDQKQEARESSRGQQAASKPHPRQRFHNGRWWYLTQDNQWLYYENGRWIPHQQPQYQAQPQYYQGGQYQYGYAPQYYGQPYGSGYRGYNGGYHNGYYGRGYYNGPGYGNRGWGNANYGSRGANQGSNIGGAIGQGLGGSGQIGAGIGAAIGNQ